jgi:hypothetical protein
MTRWSAVFTRELKQSDYVKIGGYKKQFEHFVQRELVTFLKLQNLSVGRIHRMQSTLVVEITYDRPFDRRLLSKSAPPGWKSSKHRRYQEDDITKWFSKSNPKTGRRVT